MTIATDFTAYGGATKRVSVSTASKTLAALIGETLPAGTRRVEVEPDTTGVYYNLGTASTTNIPIGVGQKVFEGEYTALNSLQFVAAAAKNMSVILGGLSFRTLPQPE